uniref:PWWP domain-containing protein n=1 Tax=Xiphophorus couchianus TaxID=32473 RepID=A0A3B5L027_9TELE
MSGHNHSHERLKDLTSLVLNGDQDALPKLCTPEPPMLKGDEAPATNDAHQHNRTPHAEAELKATVPEAAEQPPLEPSCADGAGLVTATESASPGPDLGQEAKKRRGRPNKPKLILNRSSVIPITEEGPVPTRFCVGDLVWTKVSGYPWWPCMVTTDPELNTFNSRLGLLYHIQYFGDAPERGFVFEKNMVSFTGEEQYVELSQRNKPPASSAAHRKVSYLFHFPSL